MFNIAILYKKLIKFEAKEYLYKIDNEGIWEWV
jgi:hypothetical protein